MSFRRRHHRWIALVALLGMLFQQLAMAAYVCPQLDRGSTDAVAAALQAPPCHTDRTQDKARCHEHCHPQAQSSDHASPLTVPPALLPATTWLRAPDASSSLPDFCGRALEARATAPPLTIQHCTFQI